MREPLDSILHKTFFPREEAGAELNIVACFGCAFKVSGLYVTPPMTFRHSFGLISHVIQSVGTQGRSQSVFRHSVSSRRGTPYSHVFGRCKLPCNNICYHDRRYIILPGYIFTHKSHFHTYRPFLAFVLLNPY